jgi:hypothetical protein
MIFERSASRRSGSPAEAIVGKARAARIAAVLVCMVLGEFRLGRPTPRRWARS